MARTLGLGLSGPRSYAGAMTSDPILNEGGRRDATAQDIEAAIGVLWRVWGGVFLTVLLIRCDLRFAGWVSLGSVPGDGLRSGTRTPFHEETRFRGNRRDLACRGRGTGAAMRRRFRPVRAGPADPRHRCAAIRRRPSTRFFQHASYSQRAIDADRRQGIFTVPFTEFSRPPDLAETGSTTAAATPSNGAPSSTRSSAVSVCRAVFSCPSGRSRPITAPS